MRCHAIPLQILAILFRCSPLPNHSALFLRVHSISMPLPSYANQCHAIAVRCFSIPMHLYSEYCHCLAIQSFALPWRHCCADPNCSFSFLCTPARCFASANLYRTAPKLFFALPLPGGSMRDLAFALPLLFQAVQFISLALQRAASPFPCSVLHRHAFPMRCLAIPFFSFATLRGT